MNFFQALGLSQDLISETVLAGHPAGLPVIDGDMPAPRGVIAAALVKVPVPSVIAEKFTRLERFCADAERTTFAPSDDALVLRGVTTAANPALARFKLEVLCTLLRQAGCGAPVLTLSTAAKGTGQPFSISMADMPAEPELDSSASPRITDHLAALIVADPARAWRIDDAATHLGLTGRSLQRYLLAENSTFSKVLRTARTNVARRLLEGKSHSLAEIGFCCGYADQAHFQREFRKVVQVTPRKYRLGQRAA